MHILLLTLGNILFLIGLTNITYKEKRMVLVEKILLVAGVLIQIIAFK